MKKKTAASSNSVNLPPAPKSPARGKSYVFFLPVLIMMGGLAAAFFYWPAGILETMNVRAPETASVNSFVFIPQTRAWLGSALTLNVDKTTLDLSLDISSWLGSGLFSYRLKSLDLRASKSVNEIVFASLGVVNPWQAIDQNQSVWGFDLELNNIYNKLSSEVAPGVNRLPQDAVLTIENGRATSFAPDQTGQTLDAAATSHSLRRALFQKQLTVAAAVLSTPPQVRLNQTNRLGISEQIAHGESNFTGSSANRITNIRVGAERFNGLILKPDEEFSFNKYLGEVTAAGGFKPEIVIKPYGMVPELGGGLCQVSTTAFRAALYGGLPITARRNHSFAVGYYAPQGTDATIYPGAVDLKFVNDTPSFLLIATRVEGKKLIFDFYGTPDGRTVKIDGPQQYDFGPGGAMKAKLTRTVTSGVAVTSQEFFSKYVSRDLFPRVEEFPKPATAVPPAVPQTPPTETPPATSSGEQNPPTQTSNSAN